MLACLDSVDTCTEGLFLASMLIDLLHMTSTPLPAELFGLSLLQCEPHGIQCKLQIHVLHGHVTQQVLLCYSVLDALLSMAFVYVCYVASSYL